MEIPEPLQEGGTVGDEEYEVYTALCHSADLFLFYKPGTTFDDLTRDELNYIYNGRDRWLGDLHERVLQYSGLLRKLRTPSALAVKRAEGVLADFTSIRQEKLA